MVAESPNLYIANLPKKQQESKDFVRCICLDNNQKRGWAELLQKNWKTILYLLDEAQFVDADTPPKLDLRMEELVKKKPEHRQKRRRFTMLYHDFQEAGSSGCKSLSAIPGRSG